jgi:glycosyltransferase involved in cell wall biosynthesis
MRIAIVSDAWYPQINGVVRTLDTVRGMLAAQGHVVTAFGPDRFRTLPCPTYPEIRLALVAGRALGRMIRDFQPDTIHVATEGPLGIAARRLCRATGLPFTTSFHTKFPDYVKARFGLPEGLSYAWLRRFHAAAAHVMVATPSLEETLRARGFLNLVRWTRGVDTALFRPREAFEPSLIAGSLPPLKRPLALYVGRLAVEKNIEAFCAMDFAGSKVVVGDGPLAASLRARYPGVHFTGPRTGEALAATYAACDLFVFPSRTDTFGLVLLEAMASGLPVAAYPVTGPIDVLADQPADAPAGIMDEDLGAAVRRALRLDPRHARDHALRFSWQHSAAQFLANLVPVRRAA